MVFVVLGVAGDAELLIEPQLRQLEVAFPDPRCTAARRQEVWEIKDCLQVSKAQLWFLEVGYYIADRVKVLEYVVQVEALDLGFGLRSGHGF